MKIDLRVVFEKGKPIDEEKVQADQRKRSLGSLRKIGAYILKTARRSIRRGVKDKKGASGMSRDMRVSSDIFQKLTGRPAVFNKASKPGQPPRSHTGNLKAGMNFQIDGQTMVVGALRYKKNGARFLEHGGTPDEMGPNPYARLGLSRFMVNGTVRTGFLTRDKQKILSYSPDISGEYKFRSVKNGSLFGPSLVKYKSMQARPFMGPALTKTSSKLPEFFRG